MQNSAYLCALYLCKIITTVKKSVLIVLLALLSFSVSAQRLTLGTNVFNLADYGTLNVEAGYSLSQHYSVVGGLKYNPWDFSKDGGDVYKNLFAVFAGVRYWPWYTNSGVWIQAKAQYADYSITGTWRHALDEGRAAGIGVAAGYTFMLSPHFNVELGLGGWAGRLFQHNLYECSDCMRLRESGPRGFVDLDNVAVSLIYIF